MFEVRPGLLLGSMGDALAVFTRVPSLVARYQVTHVISLCNEQPEWMEKLAPEEREGSGSERGEDDIKEEEEGESAPAKEAEEEVSGEKEKRGRRRRGRRGKGSVELPRRRMFVQVADMPKSDLLHQFMSCCHFIREGRERGTILVHCEHGVSRSVTVVLAYLMWAERKPLKVLYQQLKERKPEIRPNSGFMDQLRLWEEMGCRVKEENKRYRAYRLQCKAREIESVGYVEAVDMAPDPSTTPVDAALYFRCRKCRKLLFTDSDVLQHELGEGREAFRWQKRKKGGQGGSAGVTQSRETVQQMEGHRDGQDEAMIEGVDSLPQQQSVGLQNEEDGGVATSLHDAAASPNSGPECHKELGELKKRDKDAPELAVLGGNPDLEVALPDPPLGRSDPSQLPAPSPLTPADLAKMREEVASVLAQGVQGSALTLAACSSYFIEPVAWMGDMLLGHLEGKILCPKCNSRLGSFSWKGQQCSCGRWLIPAFQVHKNRVDEVRTLSRRKNAVQH